MDNIEQKYYELQTQYALLVSEYVKLVTRLQTTTVYPSWQNPVFYTKQSDTVPNAYSPYYNYNSNSNFKM